MENNELKHLLIAYKSTVIGLQTAHDEILSLFSVGKSVVCGCDKPDVTWYGNDNNKQYFCFNCKKEAN